MYIYKGNQIDVDTNELTAGITTERKKYTTKAKRSQMVIKLMYFYELDSLDSNRHLYIEFMET